ncbi:hypothetical protein IFM89_009249 [Coptis chinensis]|uniref:Transposase n=1 Tax=Coptis chinensis TaxID=261450 RepID=A0A835IB47_9MAGN|nr:hypothetical protein IFM89_009249 [Coptis chinensis]
MVETRASVGARNNRPILKTKKESPVVRKPPKKVAGSSTRKRKHFEEEEEREKENEDGEVNVSIDQIIEYMMGNNAKEKTMEDGVVGGEMNEDIISASVREKRMEDAVAEEETQMNEDIIISTSVREKRMEDAVAEPTEEETQMNEDISSTVNEKRMDDGAGVSNVQEQGIVEPDTEGLPMQKKMVYFNHNGQPIGEGSTSFVNDLGSMMRKYCPISYDRWSDMPDQTKDLLWKTITDKYIVPVAYKGKVLQRIHNYWRSFKSVIRCKHYDLFDTDDERKANCPKGVRQDVWEIFVDKQSTPVAQARRKAGKFARQAMKTPHTSGRTGAARTAEALKKGNPFATVTRTDLYVAMHTRKDGSCPTPELTSKVKQIKDITERDPSSINLDVDHDPVAQVYGPEKKGFVRGLGIGVSKTTLLHSAPAVDQLQQERMLRLSAEEQIANLREQVVSQTVPPSVDQLQEESRASLCAEEPIADPRRDMVCQMKQTNQLQLQREPQLLDKEQIADLREQGVSQRLVPLVDQLQEERRLRLSAEEQLANLRQQVVSQKDQIDQLQQERETQLQQERRLRLSAEEQIADLRQQVVSQRVQIDQLQQERLPQLNAPQPSTQGQITDLREQMNSQGLMIADLRELIVRLSS